MTGRRAWRWRAAVLGLLCVVRPAAAQTPVVEYYHLDALCSVRAVTNAAGAVVSRHEYEPFGEEWQPVVPPTTARQFTGKERDPETGLDYFGARYYRADLGQFTTVDPFLDPSAAMGDPQQWNRYAYARGNPLRYTDPNGKWIETLWDAANVAMGAKSAYDNFRAGNVLSGVVDTGGAIVDLAAAIIPVVPGGVGTAIKAARAAERIDDAVDAVRGGETAATRAGRQAHREFAEKVNQKPGWRSEPHDLVDPATGRKVVPDAVSPSGRPVELKPDTPSGRRAGAQQLKKYERATGRRGRVVYYDPPR